MSSPLNMPGGPLSSRPLHFYWVCDVSASMKGRGKIEQLNYAIREALPQMKQVADQNPNAQVYIRTLAFGSNVEWMNPSMIPIEQYIWNDLTTNGVTSMGKALSMVASELRVPPMPQRALPPVIVLISDGHPTDDFDSGLRALMNEKWGMKAIRIAIAIGADADSDVLRRFIGNDEFELLNASNPQQLINYIRWASTEVLQYASREFFAPDNNAPIEQETYTTSSDSYKTPVSAPISSPTAASYQQPPPSQNNFDDLVW
ncbi:hypothetical protein DSECCO2_22260 [anaerobic digester metagenome]